MKEYFEPVCNMCCDVRGSAKIVADAIEKAHNGFTCDGIATLIGTLLVGIIASAIAIYSFVCSEKKTAKNDMIAMLDRLITISVEYPHLESKSFISNWTESNDDGECLRYDNYCCMVFNFIERLWIYSKKDILKMNNIVYYAEYISLHRNWWEANSEMNKNCYPEGFYEFIEVSIAEIIDRECSQGD